MYRASIIVVVWNGERYLKDCLRPVLAQRGPDDEVIVVDNGSTDRSVGVIRETFPRIRLIENNRNLGFAGGANVGLRASMGRFLIVLNQDVEVLPGWLDCLLDTFNIPGVGVAGCKLLYPDGRIQHAGGIIRWPLGLSDHFGYGQPDDGRWDELQDVDYVTGAAWGFRREVVEQIGLLDEGFWPGYYEDVDYCVRASKVGWRVVCNPKSVAVHKESSSLGKGSKTYLEAMHRGRLRFIIKHAPLVQFGEQFFPAEERFYHESSIEIRRALARAYFATILSIPDILDSEDSGIAQSLIERLAHLRSIATSSLKCEVGNMTSGQDFTQGLPILQEFHFPSKVPVIGPLISFIRRLLYNLTAKWGVWAVIQQQNRINQMIEERFCRMEDDVEDQLHNLRTLLVDMDRDLALLARMMAEIEVRQRYLLRVIQSQSERESPAQEE